VRFDGEATEGEKNECARRANDTMRWCMQKCTKFLRRELKVQGVWASGGILILGCTW
jgi:hypothetical protein